MEHYWSLDEVNLEKSWLTIGSFDGVHRGHQEIIRQLTAGAHAEGVPAVVLSFYPHPAAVLGKRQGPLYLCLPEQRADLLANLGVDVAVTHPFNKDVAALTARQFMEKVHNSLNPSQLWVGYDFALGRGREGTIPMLTSLGQELGYSVHVVPPFSLDGQVVSSSQVRLFLTDGEIEQANHLLGRPYQLEGIIVPGDGRGRTIGIPTANLDVWSSMVLPKWGIYVCRAWPEAFPGQSWGAVTNVGVRPTFETGNVQPRVEAHLLDFSHDLYGRNLKLDFLARLRDEERFNSVQALVDQIHLDIAKAREILG